MRVRMSHAFAVNANERVREGSGWNEHHDVGRFAVHFAKMANPAQVQVVHHRCSMSIHVEENSFHDVEARLERVKALDLDNVNVRMVSAKLQVVFMILEYEADLEHQDIVKHLHTMCRARERMYVEDTNFSDWLAHRVPDGVGLATDVLQVVDFMDEDPALLKDAEGLTALSRSLVSREWSTERRPTAVELPPEMNTTDDACFAHGRGVIVSAGHSPQAVAAALMVVADLLFAAAEVRRIRSRLSYEIEKLRDRLASDHNEQTDAELRQMITELRRCRLTLAADVIPAVTGVDTPDRVLDSIRETFARSLRIDALIDGVQTLLSTLTQVVETSVAEQELARSARFEARQRQWQFWVSMMSGIIVPFALLLSFFGTGTQGDVAPVTSMWDFGHYWPEWAVALTSVVLVLAVSGWRYWRWLRGLPSQLHDDQPKRQSRFRR